MLHDTINLAEGSFISNLTVPSGTSFPSALDSTTGELFFKSDSGTLYVYNGTTWVPTSSGSGGSGAAEDLTGTTIAANVVSSSLTSVGTLLNLNVLGSIVINNNSAFSSKTTAEVIRQLIKMNGSNNVQVGQIDTPTSGNLFVYGNNIVFQNAAEVMRLTSTGSVDMNFRYTESKTTLTSTATTTLDLATSNNFVITLEINISSLVFTNVAISGRLQTITLFLIQGTGGNKTVTWPASVKWQSGAAPTLSTTATRTDIITLVTHDGGATWFGFVSGLNY